MTSGPHSPVSKGFAPVVRDQYPRRASTRERLLAGLVALAILGLLTVAALLAPAAAGHGTHESLGLPACTWPTIFDIPCPTCGMTTAFAHAADASFPEAFATQPMGAALAVLLAAGFWLALHSAVFGSRLGGIAASAWSGRAMWVGLGALLAAWAYKILTW